MDRKLKRTDQLSSGRTSPGNFQVWLRYTEPLPKERGTFAAKILAERFGADQSAADWRRCGRAPGVTNRKPQHRTAPGFYPFTNLRSATGQTFDVTISLRAQLLAAERQAQQHNAKPPASASPRVLSASRTSLSRASARHLVTPVGRCR